jgi:hypothetical protein
MNGKHEAPDLIALLSVVLYAAGALVGHSPLELFGLFGLAASVGLQAVVRSRDAAMLSALRKLSTRLSDPHHVDHRLHTWPKSNRTAARA